MSWVKDVRVNFETRQVEVKVVPEKYRPEVLVETLARAGFEGSTVESP